MQGELKNTKENKVLWSELVHFYDKQKEATRVADSSTYTLFGGSAGPGKSYWLRWYPIRWLIKQYNKTKIKGITAGLFCEDYPSLKDRHISKMQFEFPTWLGTLKEDSKTGLGFYLKQEFGSGVLALRNLDDTSKYLSSEFGLIAVDELTRNQEDVFNLLRLRKRWPGISDTKFIAATNPGGVGHAWVKKKWIDKIFDENEQEASSFTYVRALPTDNPYLDKSYINALQSLPEKMRKAYLEGNWDVFEGQFFSEWNRDKHVVEPFKIPVTWTKFRSIDVSGRSGITSCHWYAVDYDGNVWIYKEHYKTGLDADQHAREINRLSEGEDYRYTVIDSSAFDRIGLPESIAEVYLKNGITNLVPSSKNREAGWDFMHQYLRWTDKQLPKLRVFSTCLNFIRTIPTLVHSQLHPEDLETKGEDHAADECRYFLQTLRESKTPKPRTIVEQRLEELKMREEELSFTF